jgi:hypothetical protein
MNLLAKNTFAILFLLCTLASAAQREFRGGIYAGPLVSQMSGDGMGGWNKLGINFGGFVAVPMGSKLAFNAGLGFINKGSEKPADPNNGDNTVFIYRINYIEAPLLLEFQIGDMLRLKAGATAALLIKQKTWDNSTSTEILVELLVWKQIFQNALARRSAPPRRSFRHEMLPASPTETATTSKETTTKGCNCLFSSSYKPLLRPQHGEKCTCKNYP